MPPIPDPKFNTTGALFAYPFRTTIPALTTQVLLSQRISFPFRTRQLWLNWDYGANRSVSVEFFYSGDPDVSTTSTTLGTSFFAGFTTYLTLVGDLASISIPHVLTVDLKSAWLKARIINTDGFTHFVDAIVTIEPLGGQI